MRTALPVSLILAMVWTAPLSAQAGTFSVEGVQLPYERRGAGQPVILIPGWFQSYATWDGQVEDLAAAHQVIRFSRGPFGLMADPIDVVALMDHLDVHRAIIVAHSAGGLAALRLAVNFPERVEALVLYGPPAGTPGLTIPWAGADSWPAVLRQLGVEADPRAYAREVGLHAFYRVAAEHPMFAIPENQPRARARLQDMWTEYANAGARDWLDPPSPPASTRAVEAADLARLRMPTLVIIGSDEIPYFRIAADVLHYAIPGAQKRVIPGGGHFVHMVEPERFNAALLEFLSGR
jgi:3-oxoadipate enol-lactonase